MAMDNMNGMMPFDGFGEQNPQGSTTTPVAPAPNPPNVPLMPDVPKSGAPNKKRYVVFGILAVLVLLVVIVLVAVLCLGRNDDNNADVAVIDDNSVSSESVVKDFENLTKAEAMAYLQNNQNADGKLPKDYVGKEITDAVILNGNTYVSDLELVYSYDTMDELWQIVEEEYGGFGGADDVKEDDYEVKEYDYYAIVTPKRAKGATSCEHGFSNDCDSLLSFKRSYMNYLNEETTEDGDEDFRSFREVAYLNTRNPEIANYLMRVYTFFDNVGVSGGHGNIYGYDFEDRDDEFVLTVYYLGVGLNLEMISNGAEDGEISDYYAINLFSRKYVADKTSGEISIVQNGDNSIESVKSFPLTKDEFNSFIEE